MNILYSLWAIPIAKKHVSEDIITYTGFLNTIRGLLTKQLNIKYPLLASFVDRIKDEWQEKIENISCYPSDANDNAQGWMRVLIADLKEIQTNNTWKVLGMYCADILYIYFFSRKIHEHLKIGYPVHVMYSHTTSF